MPLMGLLFLSAWVTLWVWSASPYGRYVDHGSWTEIGLAGSMCRLLPAGDVVVPLLLYVGGWVLMSAAMMLPTTLPLLEIFRRVTVRRADQAGLLALVVAGYIGAWGLYGIAAHVLDWGIREVAAGSLWLSFNAWTFGAGALAVAGVFQFTPLKYHCLDRCRTPLSFVVRYWNGRHERRNAFLMGIAHGAYCVGCCWALMLLMFVVGTGSMGWMLLLAAVMALEKNMPWGRRLSAPLGLGLLAWSAFIVMDHSFPPA